MFDRRNYIIEVSKLVKGNNKFDWDIDKTLFNEFECEDVLNAKIKVGINVIRSERMIEINFYFSGELQVECSRCLSALPISVNKKNTLYIKFGEKSEEVDIEQWIISENDNEIDLSNYIYEELRVEIPIAPMHKHKKDCNKEMLDKISAINDKTKQNRENEIDPRWNKLKELL